MQVRAEGMVIMVKEHGSMKKQSISVMGRRGATSWGDPGLPRDVLYILKKVKDQWINQGRRVHRSVNT